MHVKTMKGLVGARSSMEMLNVPMRIYKEARRKGDTAAMDRAMGYAQDCADQAKEYREAAEEGMEKDAEEIKERAEQARSQIIQKQKAEREESGKKTTENGDVNGAVNATVELSREGMALLDDFRKAKDAGDMDERGLSDKIRSVIREVISDNED